MIGGDIILNNESIAQKINRLAYEIYENNHDAKSIVLAGINNNGFTFSTLIAKKLKEISNIDIEEINIRLNPASPKFNEVALSCDLKDLQRKSIIIIDDVANTGRTLFYAFTPLLQINTKKIEIAVLVDRKHKKFPVLINYVGLSLATTLKDEIRVVFEDQNNYAYLME